MEPVYIKYHRSYLTLPLSPIVSYLVSALQLHEAWDLLESMKKLVDDDRGRARSLLEAYPQLIGALIEVQVELLSTAK